MKIKISEKVQVELGDHSSQDCLTSTCWWVQPKNIMTKPFAHIKGFIPLHNYKNDLEDLLNQCDYFIDEHFNEADLEEFIFEIAEKYTNQEITLSLIN